VASVVEAEDAEATESATRMRSTSTRVAQLG
jgi:hypothetical protein